jgi:hypothetical protein
VSTEKAGKERFANSENSRRRSYSDVSSARNQASYKKEMHYLKSNWKFRWHELKQFWFFVFAFV